MFAIRIDADNSYYSVAYAVVERESYNTWKWFLKFLRIDLNLNQPFGITFMTDKQKGLVEAINELWRDSEHRFYVRHMYANFKKKFKGDLIRNKVWQAVKSSIEEEWKDIMEKIKIMTQESIGQQINMDNIKQLLANVRTLKQHYATKLIPHLTQMTLYYTIFSLKTKLKKKSRRKNKLKKEKVLREDRVCDGPRPLQYQALGEDWVLDELGPFPHQTLGQDRVISCIRRLGRTGSFPVPGVRGGS
ncbi:hypothetical protein LWI29_022819 [Acer saccharum]|uniref:MULE transposase domain-containing protein n=1 Tax=Acer saccharum TaxID=4024 RepID=A0AA39VM01_ACESA|nr:hypothetical protein LWI29_022819 [Acer saccharum]